MATSKKRNRKIKDYVIERDGLICCYCDKVLTDLTMTLEHIVADSKNGSFNTTNLTVACAKCNNKRGNEPFFDYCKQFNWFKDKIDKYRKLYYCNLKIKVLNIAKGAVLDIENEECSPLYLINEACKVLRIRNVDFSNYEKEYFFDINFLDRASPRKVKICFEQLIKIIEADSW